MTTNLTATGTLILNTELTVGMKTSTGHLITGIRRTAKQVHVTTISAVDGLPIVERLHPDGQTFIRTDDI